MVDVCPGVELRNDRMKSVVDIDFLGGTSVQAQLKQPMPYDEVWDKLAEPRIAQAFALIEGRSGPQFSTLREDLLSFQENIALHTKKK